MTDSGIVYVCVSAAAVDTVCTRAVGVESERVNLLCGFHSIGFICVPSVQCVFRGFHAVTKDPCETSLFTLQ